MRRYNSDSVNQEEGTMRVGRILLYGLVAAGVACAQATGTISGTVITKAGAGVPVPKAQVRAKNTDTGTPYGVQTSANGSYALAGLTAGNYDLSVESPPLFIPFQRKDVRVQAGETVRIDVSLDDLALNTLGDGGEQFVAINAEHPVPSGRTPKTRSGKPDLTGVWFPSTPIPVGGPPEPLPWAEAAARQRGENLGKDLPQSHCLPMGPSWSGFFTPYRFVQTPDLLVIIDENGDPARQIYLDGRAHPKEFNPAFMGHSVAHWEGDTLVVDSVGFNDRAWLSLLSYPQTEKMHIIERYRRPDLGHLELEMTLDDPGAFKKPWKVKRLSSLAPKSSELVEYVCTENNRDVQHLVGK